MEEQGSSRGIDFGFDLCVDWENSTLLARLRACLLAEDRGLCASPHSTKSEPESATKDLIGLAESPNPTHLAVTGGCSKDSTTTQLSTGLVLLKSNSAETMNVQPMHAVCPRPRSISAVCFHVRGCQRDGPVACGEASTSTAPGTIGLRLR